MPTRTRTQTVATVNTTPPAPPMRDGRLVAPAFRHLLDPHHLTPTRARELGRALGAAARTHDLADHLDAFAELGIGSVRLTRIADDRYAFDAHDLHGSERPDAAGCALALGFLEGAVRGTTGRHALGAQILCRSRGHTSCTFSITAR